MRMESTQETLEVRCSCSDLVTDACTDRTKKAGRCNSVSTCVRSPELLLRLKLLQKQMKKLKAERKQNEALLTGVVAMVLGVHLPNRGGDWLKEKIKAFCGKDEETNPSTKGMFCLFCLSSLWQTLLCMILTKYSCLMLGPAHLTYSRSVSHFLRFSSFWCFSTVDAADDSVPLWIEQILSSSDATWKDGRTKVIADLLRRTEEEAELCESDEEVEVEVEVEIEEESEDEEDEKVEEEQKLEESIGNERNGSSCGNHKRVSGSNHLREEIRKEET